MAAMGIGGMVLDGTGEPVMVLLPECVGGLVPVGEVTAKDIIDDKATSLKPLVGAVLVAPPSLLYVEGQNCVETGRRR
jgi:hypothetical protein